MSVDREPFDGLDSREPKVAKDAAHSTAIRRALYWLHSSQRIGCF